ncbi:MAG: nucleotidyltransferase domain-containing protein [Gemmatimonadetes bacterium]|nr:nucleotidyltransferase domain-containing protein [Gemmatimonadota bacterium]
MCACPRAACFRCASRRLPSGSASASSGARAAARTKRIAGRGRTTTGERKPPRCVHVPAVTRLQTWRYARIFRSTQRAPARGDPVLAVSELRDPRLAEVVRRLVNAYRPEQIYLFGSYARGDAGPDSDYDLLLVVPDDAPPERRRARLAYEVLWGTGTAADVLVWTRARFDARAHVVTSLPATVLREGKLLHAA